MNANQCYVAAIFVTCCNMFESEASCDGFLMFVSICIYCHLRMRAMVRFGFRCIFSAGSWRLERTWTCSADHATVAFRMDMLLRHIGGSILTYCCGCRMGSAEVIDVFWSERETSASELEFFNIGRSTLTEEVVRWFTFTEEVPRWMF